MAPLLIDLPVCALFPMCLPRLEGLERPTHFATSQFQPTMSGKFAEIYLLSNIKYCDGMVHHLLTNYGIFSLNELLILLRVLQLME